MKKYLRYPSLFGFCFIASLATALHSHTLWAAPAKSDTASISKQDEELADVVILGGGIGGLTSGLYLARAGHKPIVVAGPHPGGLLVQTMSLQNWPGEKDIPGTLLTDKAREQTEASGARILNQEAIAVDFSTSPFTITTRDPWQPDEKKILRAKACIIATGALPNKLNVPGEETFWSRGVHTCATCDGTLYKGRPVAVVGGSDGAIVEALHLAKLASKVTLIVRGPALKSIEERRKQDLLVLPNVEVLYETQVKEIVGTPEKLTHVVLTEKKGNAEKTLSVDAVFLGIGSRPNTSLFKGQLQLDNQGYIVLKKDQSTSLPGVYATGDVSDPIFRQAITAAGDGAKAALQTEHYLASAKAEKFTSSPQRASTHVKQTTDSAPVRTEPLVVQIKSVEQFNREVLESDIPVVVDFYADWCGPCRTLNPHIEAWSKQFNGRVKFAKVNVDYLQKIAERYRIAALPTVLYFGNDGQLTETCTGTQEIADLMMQLQERLETNQEAYKQVAN